MNWRKIRASSRSAKPVSIIIDCRASKLAKETQDAGVRQGAANFDGRRNRSRTFTMALTNRNKRVCSSNSSISRWNSDSTSSFINATHGTTRSKSCGRIPESCAAFFIASAVRLEQANEVIALGHLVSFTGIVTFKNGAAVREVAAQISAFEVHGRNRLSISRAGAVSRKTLRTGAHTLVCRDRLQPRAAFTLRKTLPECHYETAEEFFRFS